MNATRANQQPSFQLTAYPPSTQLQSAQAVRSLLESSAAAVTDIRHYSNNHVVFQLVLPLVNWPAFVDQLLSSGFGVEAPSASPAPGLVDQDGDITGTLSVVLRGGAESRNIIPAVPG